jgi:fermentation-respiration switch protein FrsA (DUF1100 family)
MTIGVRLSVATISGVIIAGLLALSWTLSSSIMHPSYQCSEEHFIYCDDPSQLQLPFEDIWFQSNDGLRLSGWYIPAVDSTKTVIFVHGHGADRREGMRWFRATHRAGFNILALDLRHSGSSEGPFSSMGFYEKNDVIAAVDYLQRRSDNQSIGVFGVSMGAATSIMAMVEDPRILAGVFEAGWSNLSDLYSDIIKQHLGVPSFPLLPVTSWILELRTGMDMDQLNPEQLLGQIAPRPVFIIHCTGDKLIDFSHGERNYAAANEPKEFWKSPCETHARAWQSDPEYIEQRVVEYYLQHL